MAHVSLGGMTVFPLCLGGNPFGWTADADTSFAILDAFEAVGGNLIDTADVYSAWKPGNQGGESETIIGDWMRERNLRADTFVATKVAKLKSRPGLSAANVALAADESLRRLSTDYIDLYYAHEDDQSVPLEETAQAFDTLVRAGKVRHIGLSNYSGERIREYIRIATDNGWAGPVAVQNHYNLVERAGYESDSGPVIAELGLASLPYFSLASGFLTGKYRSVDDTAGVSRSVGVAPYLTDAGFALVEGMRDIANAHGVDVASVALAWLRSRPGTVIPIASVSHVTQLAGIVPGATITLTADDLTVLDSLSSTF
jgi:aryl-alcohol dehydrogenase-like predicted oxidoreductase